MTITDTKNNHLVLAVNIGRHLIRHSLSKRIFVNYLFNILGLISSLISHSQINQFDNSHGCHPDYNCMITAKFCSYCNNWIVVMCKTCVIRLLGIQCWEKIITIKFNGEQTIWSEMGPMMTSSNGNIFHVTGPLWGESDHQWIPLTKASNTGLWCFLWSTPEQTVEQTVAQVIWHVIALIMRVTVMLDCFVSMFISLWLLLNNNICQLCVS